MTAPLVQIGLPAWLYALVQLSGVGRMADWTDEAIAREQLRHMLRKSLHPLAGCPPSEPCDRAASSCPALCPAHPF